MTYCLHCGTSKAAPDRKGLCQRCSLRPEVRALYVTRSKYGRRGVGSVETGQTPSPTEALPGTAAKIEVFAERAERGTALFHDRDERPVEPWTVPVVGFTKGAVRTLMETESGRIGGGD